MTVENCVGFCNKQNYIYAGVEYGQGCCKWAIRFSFYKAVVLTARFWVQDCGDTISDGGTKASLSDCNFPCPGNATEVCGAGNRLNLYWSGATPPVPPAPPVIAQSYGLWVSAGCYK